MAKITFITTDDESITLEGTSGSVMQLAVDNGVSGIDGKVIQDLYQKVQCALPNLPSVRKKQNLHLRD